MTESEMHDAGGTGEETKLEVVAGEDIAETASKHVPPSDADFKETDAGKNEVAHKDENTIKNEGGEDEDDTAPTTGFFGSDNFQRLVVTINVLLALYSALMAALLSVFVPQRCCPPVLFKHACRDLHPC